MFKFVGYLIRKNPDEFFAEFFMNKEKAKRVCSSNGLSEDQIVQIFNFEKQPVNEVAVDEVKGEVDE